MCPSPLCAPDGVEIIDVVVGVLTLLDDLSHWLPLKRDSVSCESPGVLSDDVPGIRSLRFPWFWIKLWVFHGLIRPAADYVLLVAENCKPVWVGSRL